MKTLEVMHSKIDEVDVFNSISQHRVDEIGLGRTSTRRKQGTKLLEVVAIQLKLVAITRKRETTVAVPIVLFSGPNINGNSSNKTFLFFPWVVYPALGITPAQ